MGRIKGKKLNTDEVWNFHENGYSITKLAKQYDVSESSISYHLRKKRREDGTTKGIWNASHRGELY